MVNEASILFYLLTRVNKDGNIGATENELLKKLALGERGKPLLIRMLSDFGELVAPLGLEVKFNPLSEHWFLGFSEPIPYLINDPNFSDMGKGVLATLFAVLLLSLEGKNVGVTVGEIADIRKKKGITQDLEELEKRGFIYRKGSEIFLTPKIFYYIDADELLSEIGRFMRGYMGNNSAGTG